MPKNTLIVFAISCFLSAFTLSYAQNFPANSINRVSKPGVYSGYTEAVYADEYALSSQYIDMRDGTKLAIDICRPKDKTTGKVIETPLPVLWMHTPYNRRYNSNDKAQMTVDCYAGTASRLVKYGYVVATVDFRGLYSSFGHNQGYNRGEWITAARYDAYDITEWLAKQPWSNGKIGMWGCSATGGSQMQAATTAPPHLKAIFPMSFEFDVYDFRVPGGISGVRGGVRPQTPGSPTPQQVRDALAAPVDSDTDSILLKQAIAEHAGTIESEGSLPFRDSYSKNLTDNASKQWWVASSPSSYIDQINSSGIAMYMAVNWDEGSTKPGPFFAINNFTIPRKLIIGPGTHCDWFTSMQLTGFDITIEERRFFDYWLKGIDNGIMSEAPVYYYTYNAPKGSEWQSAKSWPLPQETRELYYLDKGSLTTTEPSIADGRDRMKVSLEKGNKATFVYETPALQNDLQITGHPKIKLWVSSTATDGDFMATINDIAPDGKTSSYNIYGQLRASMRKTAKAPNNYLGLPWHSFKELDAKPLTPGEPTELEFAILPISIIIKAGHKIQLVVNVTNHSGTQPGSEPEVTIYRDATHKSCLSLPVLK
jgi:predicted acyl esterase